MAKLRMGMVGCGDISDRFFKMAREVDDADFVATCARRLENARRKGEEYGVSSHYSSYERMMDEENLDAVFVTTPHSVHAEVCLAAIERGLHVLNEKPMATSLEDCRAMADAAEEADVTFMALPYDQNGAILTAQSLLRERYIGKITGGEACLNIPGPPRDNWYYDRSVAHGGAMLDCFVYPAGRVTALLGGASRVTGMSNTLIPKRIVGDGKQVNSDVDDNVTLVVEYAGGQHVVIRSLWGAAYAENSTTIYGREGSVILPGDGRVILQRRDGVCDVDGAEPTGWRGWSGCFTVPTVSGVENMTEHFVRCILDDEEPTCSGARTLHVHEIMFAGYESAETGQTVTLYTDYEPWHDLDPAIFDTRGEFI
ncbi:Gfo/Idh/MocA family oxidoreductase [Candidatus Poribacteria bacterium]|jgi:predicted dehydrogenase|nr:Gfo/Idh/MocA family oxidoreductase [Candidatus Poribacteria bacterium]MBT5533791.1 Gfo/Idh/MocA family oxidoreductase [Candidatus Poribacteria bacterium]MBT5715020.1 Gfo/Idh/MocA family oxidoreductase [Candidatus Poribacteria bacterium]MBT7100688.1 Gfo/Idh/MocA family oxidoreductase [Candidatus Poribacteria bacterium]MBT7806676.1 Gfo/Idh/MocA family oxidoreductase [Candidatus Poribacteria bacterium]